MTKNEMRATLERLLDLMGDSTPRQYFDAVSAARAALAEPDEEGRGGLQSDRPLNTYVWKHALTSGGYGLVVVSAPTVEIARRIASADYEGIGPAAEAVCISDRQQVMALFGD